MHDACASCHATFKREPGFYLGSIYINYGVTVIVTGALYALFVLGIGWSNEAALSACLVSAVLFPVWFFRYARSLLLALDGSVNQQQSHAGAASGDSEAAMAALSGDDARAGCAMGVALALILLFGLGMALVTILFTVDAEAASHDAAGFEHLDHGIDALPHRPLVRGEHEVGIHRGLVGR
jgi:hypothetical protein